MARAAAIFLVLAANFAVAAASAKPLVDPAWVISRIGDGNTVFLDVRAPSAYRRGHVPGAVQTSYGRGGWRVKKDGVPGMLPPMPRLEKLIGGLGISNSHHVVILPGGYSSGEMGVATRIYWTFKVAGHDAVSILDGGMTRYMADKRAPLEKGAVAPKPASFTARFRPEYLATQADVNAAVSNGGGLIDSRPNDQYLGVNKSGQVARHGTVPGAVNLPGRWTTVDDGGRFRDREILQRLFDAVKAPTTGDTIAFCNTGHWASLGWFVQREILGNPKARLYDGSMADWARRPGNRVEHKLPLN